MAGALAYRCGTTTETRRSHGCKGPYDARVRRLRTLLLLLAVVPLVGDTPVSTTPAARLLIEREFAEQRLLFESRTADYEARFPGRWVLLAGGKEYIADALADAWQDYFADGNGHPVFVAPILPTRWRTPMASAASQ